MASSPIVSVPVDFSSEEQIDKIIRWLNKSDDEEAVHLLKYIIVGRVHLQQALEFRRARPYPCCVKGCKTMMKHKNDMCNDCYDKACGGAVFTS